MINDDMMIMIGNGEENIKEKSEEKSRDKENIYICNCKQRS